MTPQSISSASMSDSSLQPGTVQEWGEAERQLQRNREIVRQHLNSAPPERGPFSIAREMAHLAAPVARELVRQHPVATLSGAALAGAWLVKIKPWQFLGSSMIAGLIARQAVALSLSSGSQLLSLLTSSALRGQSATRTPPPSPPTQ